MLKRNGKLGIDIAGIEPVSLRNQKGGLPTEPRWGLTAADGVCRNLRIFCICGCFVATLHRNCRSLGLRVLSEHHGDGPRFIHGLYCICTISTSLEHLQSLSSHTVGRVRRLRRSVCYPCQKDSLPRSYTREAVQLGRVLVLMPYGHLSHPFNAFIGHLIVSFLSEKDHKAL